MAKPSPKPKKKITVVENVIDSPVNRKGIHAKRGTSRLKTSKNYKKAYRGQGRSR